MDYYGMADQANVLFRSLLEPPLERTDAFSEQNHRFHAARRVKYKPLVSALLPPIVRKIACNVGHIRQSYRAAPLAGGVVGHKQQLESVPRSCGVWP